MKRIFLSIFLSTAFLSGIRTVALSQTTETFESVASGVSFFTSNGVNFTLLPSGQFANDASLPGYGYSSSNKFIDNYGVGVTSLQIKSATSFTVKNMYFYPASDTEGSSNQTVGVNVTFTGKLAGSVKFTFSPPASAHRPCAWAWHRRELAGRKTSRQK